MWDPDWGLPRVKRGTVGCNPTSLAAGGGIGYIVKRAKRAQRRESWAMIWNKIYNSVPSAPKPQYPHGEIGVSHRSSINALTKLKASALKHLGHYSHIVSEMFNGCHNKGSTIYYIRIPDENILQII